MVTRLIHKKPQTLKKGLNIGCVISCDYVDDFSFGKTYHDAMFECLTSLVDQRDVLARRVNLAPHFEMILERLNNLLASGEDGF